MFESVCEHCDCFADCTEYMVDYGVTKDLCADCIGDVERGVWLV